MLVSKRGNKLIKIAISFENLWKNTCFSSHVCFCIAQYSQYIVLDFIYVALQIKSMDVILLVRICSSFGLIWDADSSVCRMENDLLDFFIFFLEVHQNLCAWVVCFVACVVVYGRFCNTFWDEGKPMGITQILKRM